MNENPFVKQLRLYQVWSRVEQSYEVTSNGSIQFFVAWVKIYTKPYANFVILSFSGPILVFVWQFGKMFGNFVKFGDFPGVFQDNFSRLKS